jgi:hypothetical protein
MISVGTSKFTLYKVFSGRGIGQVVRVELLQCIRYELCGAWVLCMRYTCILWRAGYSELPVYESIPYCRLRADL